MRPSLPKDTVVHRLIARVKRRTTAAKERLLRYFLVLLLVRTAQEMSADDATHMAAGVAYYALFSLFPLLIGVMAIISVFVALEDVEGQFTEFASGYLPGSEDLIKNNIETVRRLRGALSIFALLGLFWSGSAIFGAISRAVNRAWDVHKDRPLYVGKPRQMVMALGVGVLFLLSLSTSIFVRVAGRLAELDFPGVDLLLNAVVLVVIQGSSLVLTLGVFGLIYKFMPNTKTYWRYIWLGALTAAILFEISKNLFIFYLNRYANLDNFGTFVPIIVFMLWTYVSSIILIMGAELSSEFGRLKQGVERGTLIHQREP